LVLEWLADPVVRALQKLPQRPAVFPVTPNLVPFYAGASVAAGVLLALPFLSRVVCSFARVKPLGRAKLRSRWFIVGSYLVIVIGLLVARLLLPLLVSRSIDPDATGAVVSYFTNSYLPAALATTVAVVVFLEFCAVFAAMCLPDRAPPNPSHGSDTGL
jgi:hypothetical protein